MILVNGEEIITRFPNGEACLHKDKIRKERLDFNNIVQLRYESDADLFDLLLVKKALWFPVTLEILYMPYSRMDRNSKEYVFTLKALGKYINWLEFQKVIIYEPHSDVTPAILNHVEVRMLIPDLLKSTDFDEKEDWVLFPDAGAQKKYSPLLNVPHEMVGYKVRDFKTGEIKNTSITAMAEIWPAKARVFIVDDLCSKGGTFMGAATKLREMDSGEVNLVVAHCEENIFNGNLLSSDLVSNIYTSNSLITDNRGEKKLHIREIL